MLYLMYLKNGDRAFNPDHAMWFCPQTVKELLRRAGFKVTNLYFVDDLRKDSIASYYYKTYVTIWKAARWFAAKDAFEIPWW